MKNGYLTTDEVRRGRGVDPEDTDFVLDFPPRNFYDRVLIFLHLRQPRRYRYSMDPIKSNYP